MCSSLLPQGSKYPIIILSQIVTYITTIRNLSTQLLGPLDPWGYESIHGHALRGPPLPPQQEHALSYGVYGLRVSPGRPNTKPLMLLGVYVLHWIRAPNLLAVLVWKFGVLAFRVEGGGVKGWYRTKKR